MTARRTARRQPYFNTAYSALVVQVLCLTSTRVFCGRVRARPTSADVGRRASGPKDCERGEQHGGCGGRVHGVHARSRASDTVRICCVCVYVCVRARARARISESVRWWCIVVLTRESRCASRPWAQIASKMEAEFRCEVEVRR